MIFHIVCHNSVAIYRCQSNPTILERKESEISVSDVRISLSERPRMVDAAVQVTPHDWSNPYLTSFTTTNDTNHHGNNGFRILSSTHRKSRSLQSTPKILRKNVESSPQYELSTNQNGTLSNGESQREQDSERRKLEDILKSIQSSTQSLELRGSSEDRDSVCVPVFFSCYIIVCMLRTCC